MVVLLLVANWMAMTVAAIAGGSWLLTVYLFISFRQ